MKIHTVGERVFTCAIIFLNLAPVAFNNAEIRTGNSVNGTEEIKELFNGIGNAGKQIERSSSIDLNMKGNHFAEGSSYNEDKKPETSSVEKSQPTGREHGPVNLLKNISQIIISDKNVNIINDGAKINDTSLTKLNNDSSLKNKLNDDTDLTLGIPQVDHINGSSSIKARKGVIDIPIIDDKPNLSKIVPRKGVPSDNDSLPNCFKTNNNTCFNVTKFHDLDCSCCNGSSNKSQQVISPENSVNCTFCKPIDDILVDGSLFCNKVCCKNKTLDSNKKSNSGLEIVSDVINNNKNETAVHKKKHKPTITKEPVDNDADNATISTFQSKKAVVIPIVVSLLILPLLSILIFFIYRKTRDYWDKRYYKRMDFLIDGIYND